MAPETLDSLDADSLKPLVLRLLARIDALVERNGALTEEIRALLARIAELEAKLGHLRDAMFLDARDKLLTFLSRRDVEPTNNASEQALCPSVIFRKVTNGFRSAWGAKLYADICSIVGTGRRAGRSALAAPRLHQALYVSP